MDKTEKLKKIQELLNRLDDLQAKDPVGSVERLLEEEQSKARESVGTPNGNALKMLARGLKGVQDDPRPQKLAESFEKAKQENQTGIEELSANFQEQLASLMEEVKNVDKSGKELTKENVTSLLGRLAEYEGAFTEGMKELSGKDSALEVELKNIAEEIPKIYARFDSLPDHTSFHEETTENVSRVTKSAHGLTEALTELERRLNNRINNIQRGGGNANRSILVGGDKNTLSPFTDINLKAGAGTTITYTANQTTKYTDITITATGSGSGITRSVNVVAVDTAAGSTASIDYVYVVSGTTTITLPTAVGNTNLYTVKNVGTGTVTIATTGGQTIDGDTTVIMPVQYTSVDLISDGSNWNIT